MRIHFSLLILASAVAAIAALAAQPAMAASSHAVHIPFNFVAAGQECPAGTYSVSEDNRGDTVYLSGANHSFLWMLFPGDADPRDHRVVLTFDVAGEKHELRSVQYGSMSTHRIDRKAKESIPAAQQTSIGE